MAILKSGCSAAWDTFVGLVPVKVIAIRSQGEKTGIASTLFDVDFQVTKTTGPYSKGEKASRYSLFVVPTSAIKSRKYSTTILPYTVKAD